MNLADLLANALSVSPAYQRQADARTANSYESGAIPDMLMGMNAPPGMLGGMNYAPGSPYPEAGQPNPMLPPGPQMNPMLPWAPPSPGLPVSAPMMSTPTLPQRAPIPYGAPRR